MNNGKEKEPLEQAACDVAGDETGSAGACECPNIHLAEEAVRAAKMELEKAQEFYDELCRKAADQIKIVRETTIGEVIDRTLVAVKRHPAPSLLISAALGFCLGRRFQQFFKD